MLTERLPHPDLRRISQRDAQKAPALVGVVHPHDVHTALVIPGLGDWEIRNCLVALLPPFVGRGRTLFDQVLVSAETWANPKRSIGKIPSTLTLTSPEEIQQRFKVYRNN